MHAFDNHMRRWFVRWSLRYLENSPYWPGGSPVYQVIIGMALTVEEMGKGKSGGRIKLERGMGWMLCGWLFH